MSKKARAIQKPEDLEKAARHVRYEIDIFLYAAEGLSAWQDSQPGANRERGEHRP